MTATRNTALPYWQQTSRIAPLVVFRIAFGFMMALSILRFSIKGWIEELYIRPEFYFSYYGFEWVKPIGVYTYLLFAVCFVSALMVMAGWRYRSASIALFLSFSYIELMDKTNYLNHYYFVSIICLLMIFLPANAFFSIDSSNDPEKKFTRAPRYCIDALKIMMAILYVYAGIAKLNSDWLALAQPLKIWLPAKNDLSAIGPLLGKSWTPWLFSWFGCFYDLTIVGWLMWKRTTWIAYAAVIVFHILTAILFPIGMFPYVMIVCATIFLPETFHMKTLGFIASVFHLRKPSMMPDKTFLYERKKERWLKTGFTLFFIFQILFPFRYLLYPGELFWTEEGYRFSWRVMLMEKNGYAVFTVKDEAGRKKNVVNNQEYLSRLQEKQMSFQPDMILEFAHYLSNLYRKTGWANPKVFVESYVTLNGRPGRLLIDSSVNLAAEKESFKHKKWILPLYDTIKGF